MDSFNLVEPRQLVSLSSFLSFLCCFCPCWLAACPYLVFLTQGRASLVLGLGLESVFCLVLVLFSSVLLQRCCTHLLV